MIYTTQGVTERQYTLVNGNDWQHLINAVSNPPKLSISNMQMDSYKHIQAPYVVYGTSTGVERGSSEITSRSILFIDVDDSGQDYSSRTNNINTFMSMFGTNHVIYPTINNSIKQGERLRVAIPLDTELNQEEYSKVWQVLTHNLHLNADSTGAIKAFKQLQGLYVQTSQNAHNQPIIENTGTPLDTTFFLSKYENQLKPATKRTADNLTKPNLNMGIPKWANNNRKIIRALLDPETHYSDFGGWDNMLTSIGGWVFKNTQGDIKLTADAVQDTNNRGNNPIPDNELTKKFKSWMQHWHY